MRPWFERDPDLLARELEAFAQHDIEAEVDEEARAQGVMRIALNYPGPDGRVRLIAVYPDFFPYFRPEVRAPDMQLARHQSPNGGNLCLVGRRTSHWFAEDTLASVLVEQLPHLLAFHSSGDLAALTEVEEPQGEPFGVYYNAEAHPGSYLLFDSAWHIDAACTSGTFIARVEPPQDREFRPYVTGYVETVLAEDGTELAAWSGPKPNQFSTRMVGRWLRVDTPILGDINRVMETLGPELQDTLSGAPHRDRTRHLQICALLFSEEVQQGHYADGWAFVGWDIKRQKKGQPRGRTAAFIRAARAGEGDLAARVPATVAVRNSKVALFGLGAIGSPLAMELARMGVKELRLVDGDHMEPSTARRWESGWPAFGQLKAEFLARRIEQDYPWTTAKPYMHMIGRAAEPGMMPQGQIIDEILDSADLVVDATAELGVSHLLSDLCRLRDLPFVLANATPGAWGGMVARFPPGKPCWLCLRHALYGSDPQLPLPPNDETGAGELQPPGCGEPTFSGASFDLREVSLEAARTAASMIGMDPGYDDAWQVAMLALRNDGDRVPPRWETHAIPPRPGCLCQTS